MGLLSKTRVVRGDNDNPAYITLTDKIGKGIKGAKVLVIAGGTHFINLERPKEFNHAVLEFLRRPSLSLEKPC